MTCTLGKLDSVPRDIPRQTVLEDTILDQKFLKVRSLLFCDYRLVGAKHRALSASSHSSDKLARAGIWCALPRGGTEELRVCLGAMESLSPLWDTRRWEGKRRYQSKSQRRQMTSRRRAQRKPRVPAPVREGVEGASEWRPVPVSKSEDTSSVRVREGF